MLSHNNGTKVLWILKRRDIDRVLRHTQTRAITALYVEDKEYYMKYPRVGTEQLLVAIYPFGEPAEAYEYMTEHENGQEQQNEIKMMTRVA